MFAGSSRLLEYANVSNVSLHLHVQVFCTQQISESILQVHFVPLLVQNSVEQSVAGDRAVRGDPDVAENKEHTVIMLKPNITSRKCSCVYY